MKVINQIDEPLFNRKKLTLLMQDKKTPSRHSLIESVAKGQKVKPEVVAIKKISHKYGSDEITIEAFIYENVKAYDKFVPSYLKKKSTIKKEEVAEE